MNNRSFFTLISWDSRNKRKWQKITTYCKDFGLRQVLINIYIGTLSIREQELLKKKLGRILNSQTDRFIVLLMCKSCLDTSITDGYFITQLPSFPAFQII